MAHNYTTMAITETAVSNTTSKLIEVDDSDAFITVAEFDTDTLSANKYMKCNGLTIENVGAVGAEIQFNISAWAEGDTYGDAVTYLTMQAKRLHYRIISY